MLFRSRSGACELKFLIDRAVGTRIADWARARLAADPHGGGPHGDEYRITSLYFDTEAHDVLNARGSFGRSKYRVRRYGESNVVFLERKMRRPGLLHKRRTTTPIEELPQINRSVARDDDWAGAWFSRRLTARQLQPTSELSYVRLARVHAVNGAVARLTIDDRIHVRPAKALEFPSGTPTAVLSDHVVLELKFPGPMPAIFKALVEEFALTPTNSSKYRHGMAALGYSPKPPLDDARGALSEVEGQKPLQEKTS